MWRNLFLAGFVVFASVEGTEKNCGPLGNSQGSDLEVSSSDLKIVTFNQLIERFQIVREEHRLKRMQNNRKVLGSLHISHDMPAVEAVLDEVMSVFGAENSGTETTQAPSAAVISEFLKYLQDNIIAETVLVDALERMVARHDGDQNLERNNRDEGKNGDEGKNRDEGKNPEGNRYSEKAVKYLNGVLRHRRHRASVRQAASTYAQARSTCDSLFLGPLGASVDELEALLIDKLFVADLSIGEMEINHIEARIAVLRHLSLAPSEIPPSDASEISSNATDQSLTSTCMPFDASIDFAHLSSAKNLPVELLEFTFDNIAMHNPELVHPGALIKHLAQGLVKTDSRKLETAPTRTRTVVLEKYSDQIRDAVPSLDIAGLTSETVKSRISAATSFWRLVDSTRQSLINCPWSKTTYTWFLYETSVAVSPAFDDSTTIEHVRAACRELAGPGGVKSVFYNSRLAEYVAYVNEHGALPDLPRGE